MSGMEVDFLRRQVQARKVVDTSAGRTYLGSGACHGAGSDYVDPAVMADREAFLADGGILPDELTCRGCHRDERFRFLPMWERIRHGG